MRCKPSVTCRALPHSTSGAARHGLGLSERRRRAGASGGADDIAEAANKVGNKIIEALDQDAIERSYTEALEAFEAQPTHLGMLFRMRFHKPATPGVSGRYLGAGQQFGRTEDEARAKFFGPAYEPDVVFVYDWTPPASPLGVEPPGSR